MACKKRLLRLFFWKQRFSAPDNSKWTPMLSTIEDSPIVQSPLYQKRKSSYISSGPRLWLYMLLHKHGSLTSSQIYNLYLNDSDAKNQNFFNSLSDLKKNHLHNYLRLGEMQVAKFEKNKEPYKGYEIVPEKAFNIIDPHILLNMSPLPAIWQTSYYSKFIQDYQAKKENEQNDKTQNESNNLDKKKITQESPKKGFFGRFSIFK